MSLTTSCASDGATALPQRAESASDCVPTLSWKLRSLLYSFAPPPKLLQAKSQARGWEHLGLELFLYRVRRKCMQGGRGLVPGGASSLQFFLLLGAQLLLNRLTLLAEAMETEGDSSFTLSRRVFLMAAGETFS